MKKKAFQKATKRLLSNINVVAVGRGYKITDGINTGVESLICSVIEKLPVETLYDRGIPVLPEYVGDLPTDVIETGIIKPYRTTKYRPAPGGVSIGHYAISAGTLGCLVTKVGELFILSNNHVLANSNNAEKGDPILQPGPHDGGLLAEDKIGKLEAFVPVYFQDDIPPTECPAARAAVALLNGIAIMLGRGARIPPAYDTKALTNTVDAAIARPNDIKDVTAEILEIGFPTGSASAKLGDAIRKSGRTTGLTAGFVDQVDVTVQVQYGGGKIALFTDQIMAGAMSEPGDSGSAVLNKRNKVVGLLFAGSENTTVINRIENVISELGLNFVRCCQV